MMQSTIGIFQNSFAPSVRVSRLASQVMLELNRNNAVYGMKVAIASLLQALFSQSVQTKYTLFTAPQRRTWLAGAVHNALSGHGPVSLVTVHDYLELLRDFRDFAFGGWFDPSSNYAIPAYFRQVRGGAVYPVTALHHTISYQSYRHNVILPVLLADSYECDSIVCSSRAARIAFASLLDHVADALQPKMTVRLHYKGRLDVIPLGVDTDLFAPRDKRALRARLGWPLDACVLLYFGRISLADKADLRSLIAVVHELTEYPCGRNLLLVLAGGCKGELMRTLEAQVARLNLSERVRILNSPENPHFLYAASDIFVSPADNLQESFGLTVIEAMASGIAQVVSDWNGYRDSVSHGETGFLVPTRWAACDADVGDLAVLLQGDFDVDHGLLAQSVAVDGGCLRHYLKTLIENTHLRESMGRRARERALAHFSWPVVVREYEALWTELRSIAEHIPVPSSAGHSYLQPKYAEVFGHYASSLISDDAVLRLTEAGAVLLNQGREAFPDLRHDCGLVVETVLRDVVERIAANDGIAKDAADAPAMSLASVIGRVSYKGPYRGAVVRRHAMWLLKHGFARVEQPASGDQVLINNTDP